MLLRLFSCSTIFAIFNNHPQDYIYLQFDQHYNIKNNMGRIKTSEAAQLAAVKTGFDGLAEAPWRKTPSIFKQPVTLVHTTSRETQKTPDLKSRLANLPKARDRIEKPRQIFWAKSLERLRAMVPMTVSDRIRNLDEAGHIEQRLALASKLEPTVSALNEEAVTATLCSALQLCNGTAIVGQQATKKQIDTNPLTAINFSQPLVQVSFNRF
uniref:Uncharacterized protein n=1 Tax=Ditylenchus dipsaci TaxID=166011 RepID=A0A915CWB5_9BILA